MFLIKDTNKNNLSFFYKNEPIAKVASQDLNINSEDLESLLPELPQKLSENFSLRKSLLKLSHYSELHEKFPELFEDK